MTQCERIIDYLRTHDTGITNLLGSMYLGIGSVSARVHDMEIRGEYNFRHVREKGKNRYGEDTNYVRFFLEEE